MHLTFPSLGGHARPTIGYGSVSYAFYHGSLRLERPRFIYRAFFRPATLYKETRWRQSKAAPERYTRLCCATSTPKGVSPSQDGYAWRKRVQQAKRILFFAGPALSIPLADPAMQLMDSIIIGQVTQWL